MTRVLLLGPAREAAGAVRDEFDGDTVGAVLQNAVTRYGADFERVLSVSQIWVNGNGAELGDPVGPYDEIAVLPPISGG
ncbi:MAG TPA: MoaD/ThiS family protein [Acidimicrobiales bacterium]|nr:MoaD/ThiS family protein [Acidimicrobiales bacterium]